MQYPKIEPGSDLAAEVADAGLDERQICECLYRSRRAAACGRAELLANFLGGAVWGVFRENANCGDPPG